MAVCRQSRRVVVRPILSEDCREFVGLVRASRELHRGWVAPPDTARAFRRYVERPADRHRTFLVCRRDDGAITGVINLNEIIRGPFQNAFLGYYAMAPFAGQGYMTEGLGRVLRLAFTTMKLHRLEAGIQPANERSRALARRCGFRCEGRSPRYLKIAGRWRDHEHWALLAEEWRARRGVQPRWSSEGAEASTPS